MHAGNWKSSTSMHLPDCLSRSKMLSTSKSRSLNSPPVLPKIQQLVSPQHQRRRIGAEVSQVALRARDHDESPSLSGSSEGVDETIQDEMSPQKRDALKQPLKETPKRRKKNAKMMDSSWNGRVHAPHVTLCLPCSDKLFACYSLSLPACLHILAKASKAG